MILGGVSLYNGTAATRAAAFSAMPADAPIGSLFVSTGFTATTKPALYIKSSATACERVVTQAAD